MIEWVKKNQHELCKQLLESGRQLHRSSLIPSLVNYGNNNFWKAEKIHVKIIINKEPKGETLKFHLYSFCVTIFNGAQKLASSSISI